MAPLAGKPPFATDEPDSVFADQSAPIPRPRKPNVDTSATGGARDSAYTAFDTYFTGNGPDSRSSGMGDIARGFMNVGSDYDDSSDEDQPKNKQAPPATGQSSDKHRVLYEAAMGSPPPSYECNLVVPAKDQPRSQAQHPANLNTINQPQPAFHVNASHEKTKSKVSVPTGPIVSSVPSELQVPPVALQSGIRPVVAPSPAHSRPPQAAFMRSPPPGMSPITTNTQGNPFYTGVMPGSPSPSTRTPQPLPPPPTPIIPVFARPRRGSNGVKFEEKGILRGNSEETLLPRGVGGKGDDFWRRFSMVAREEAKSGSKKSAWLRKTESGSTRLSTWVWFVGIILLIAIGGGIGVGWYFTHNKPAAAPVAIGGSANEGFTTSTSNTANVVPTKPTRVTAAPEPSNTNNKKRIVDDLVPTPEPIVRAIPAVPAAHRRSFVHRIRH